MAHWQRKTPSLTRPTRPALYRQIHRRTTSFWKIELCYVTPTHTQPSCLPSIHQRGYRLGGKVAKSRTICFIRGSFFFAPGKDDLYLFFFLKKMTSQRPCRPRANRSLIGPCGQRSNYFFFCTTGSSLPRARSSWGTTK